MGKAEVLIIKTNINTYYIARSYLLFTISSFIIS